MPKSSLFAAATLVSFFGVFLPRSVHAQIASPFNAGQNSGNNATISSFTTIGTPNFSQARRVTLSAGVTVGGDGKLIAAPVLLERLQQEITNTLTPALAPTALSAPTEFIPSPTRVSSDPALVAGANPLALQGTVPSKPAERSGALQVNLDGELIVLPATPSTQPSLTAYAQKATKSGLAPSSLLMGAEWINLGAPVDPTVQLVAAFQGLAKQPDVNRLNDAITAYNAILQSASPEILAKLSENSAFASTSKLLRNARSVFSAKP
jgi:hypothetical protein